ncbi:MAG: hypothetical protein ABJC74_04440 [Gemmatimonadota bacterium]
MADLPRIFRAILITGLIFAVGVGAVTSLIGILAILIGQASPADFSMVGKLSVIAFLVGLGFGSLLALTAHSRRLAQLSIARFAALGAGAGLIYFLLIAVNAYRHWTIANALGNLATLVILGGGSAAAVLALARRGRPALKSGEATRYLDEG